MDDTRTPSTPFLHPLMQDAPPQRIAAGVIVLAGLLIALLLHLQAGDHLPTPWDDESHFLVPARNMAHGLGLVAPQLNAPRGMFWMPDGYALVVGLLFFVIPPSLEAARWISFTVVMGAAFGFYHLSRRLQLPPLLGALLAAVWLVTPRVVVMGNIARMEALVIAWIVLALLLAANDRWLMAAAAASLAALTHPIGIPLFLIFPLMALLYRRSWRPRRRLEWAILAAVGIVWLAEIIRFIHFSDVAQAQLAFQLARKGQSGIPLTVMHLAVLLINLHGALVCWLMRKAGAREADRLALLMTLFLLAGALAMVYPLGREDWYEVYTTETANVLSLLALLGLRSLLKSPDAPRAWSRPPVRVMPRVMLLSVLIVVVPHLVVSLNQTEPIHSFGHGMSIDDSDHAAWADFMAQVEAKLTQLDQSLDEPALVVVDRLSNIGFLLTDNPWQHLRLVQVTPVTPLADDAPVSFALFTNYPPLWKQQQIEARYPDAPEMLRVDSADGEFSLRLFDLRQSPSPALLLAT
ncbi:MAG: hypothetical protein K8J31_29740 [Anaerolineae bacterium]|nr:hypothetical protein [Anaerolineae bacterium]